MIVVEAPKVIPIAHAPKAGGRGCGRAEDLAAVLQAIVDRHPDQTDTKQQGADMKRAKDP